MSFQPYIAEIKMFGGNFAPIGYAFCNGQLVSISENTALFSLLGTTYGGDGQTTFGLPDLRGRAPVHFGSSPGSAQVTLGEMGGSPAATLLTTQIPAHTHAISGNAVLPAHSGAGSLDSPGGGIPAGSASQENYAPAASANATLASAPVTGNTSVAGGSVPVSLMQPYLAVSFIIATEGIYPSRN